MPTVVKYSGPFVSMDFFRRPATKIVEETMKFVEVKARESFQRQRSKKNRNYTGHLMASFRQIPVVQEGNRIFKGIVFCGGPSAPYAPIVEYIGWKWTTGGSRDPYYFMKEGAEEGQKEIGTITIKHLSKLK